MNATVANTTVGNTLWALTDHLGSVRDLVDNSGIIREHNVYDSFGRLIREVDYSAAGAVIASTSAAAVDTIFGYTARDFDADVGLQNNRERWYDPATGRWLSQDPIGFGGGDANLYRYVGNHPTGATDPMGLWEGPMFRTPDYRKYQVARDKERAMDWAFRYGDPTKSVGGVIEFPGYVVMRNLSISEHFYGGLLPLTGQDGKLLTPPDYAMFRRGCIGLNKLRLNTSEEVFSLHGTRAFSTLDAALDVQNDLIHRSFRNTRIVISAYQDGYLDDQLTPFLLPESRNEYDLKQLMQMRVEIPNVKRKGNLGVFDFITVHQNDDRSVCFYETMDYGFSQNPDLIVKHKSKLYPPERAGTIYLVTPIADHARAPRSPRGARATNNILRAMDR